MSEKSNVQLGDTEQKQFTRLNININAETEEVLKRHKEAGTSITETVRRAVALFDMITRESRKGSHIQLVDRQGNVRELLFI